MYDRSYYKIFFSIVDAGEAKVYKNKYQENTVTSHESS